MEGLNIGGIMLGFLAVLIFAVASLVALGLLLARRPEGARLLFAAGLLCADLIGAVAALSFVKQEFQNLDSESLLIGLIALSLLLAGVGQFIAAQRSPRIHAAALGCSTASLVFLTAPLLGGYVIFRWFDLNLPLNVILSVLLAGASLLVALFLPFGYGRWSHGKSFPS